MAEIDLAVIELDGVIARLAEGRLRPQLAQRGPGEEDDDGQHDDGGGDLHPEFIDLDVKHKFYLAPRSDRRLN